MKICIEVKDTSDKIYFTQAVASADHKGEKIAITATIAGLTAFVHFRERTWKIDLSEIATEIVDQVIKEDKEHDETMDKDNGTT